MNVLNTAFIKILTIKSQCDEVASYISNIEIALYDSLKGKLSPKLVNTDSLVQTLSTLRDKLIKKGYTLGLNEITDIMQSDCSFVSYEGGTIITLLHIPVYKSQTELSAYQYLNIPLTTTDNITVITILPLESIIAVNLQNKLFIELTNYKLTHSCRRINESIFVNRKQS